MGIAAKDTHVWQQEFRNVGLWGSSCSKQHGSALRMPRGRSAASAYKGMMAQGGFRKISFVCEELDLCEKCGFT